MVTLLMVSLCGVTQRCANSPIFGMPGAVQTVDKYQGQQSDYVLLSLVRTKSWWHTGSRFKTVSVSRSPLLLSVALHVPTAPAAPNFSHLSVIKRTARCTQTHNPTFSPQLLNYTLSTAAAMHCTTTATYRNNYTTESATSGMRSLFEMCLELAPAFNKLLLKTSEQPVGESQLQLVPGEGWPATRPEYPPPPAPYSVQIADVSRMGVLVHQMASAALQCLAAAEQHAQAQAAAAAAATAAAATAGATAAANQATADAAAAATAAAAAAAGDADMDVEQEGGGANGTDETVEELEGEGSFDPDAETDE
eukprot:17864-Heterococcus_DN1.PRE.1